MRLFNKIFSQIMIVCLALSISLSIMGANAQEDVSDGGPCQLTTTPGAAIRIDTLAYDSTGEAVYSADMRFRAKLVVPDGAQLVEFGYVYTLSQYLNDNVKPVYNALEDTLYSTDGFVLEKDIDYGYSATSKSHTLMVYRSDRDESENGNFVMRYSASAAQTTYTFNLVMIVRQAYFISHAFVTRPYYVYLDENGEEITVYGDLYSRCIKYVAYTAYYAKDENGKYIESVDARVGLAEILGYRDPGSSGYY